MKIRDLYETEGSLQDDVADALPTTQVMPELKNQDAYLQYRFGMALAAARAAKEGEIEWEDESAFGENMVVVSRTPEEEEQVKMALSMVPQHAVKQISDSESHEPDETEVTSPVAQVTKNQYGV